MDEFDELVLDGSLDVHWDEEEQDFLYSINGQMEQQHPGLYNTILEDITDTLEGLVEMGLVETEVDSETGEVYYSLTEYGETIIQQE